MRRPEIYRYLGYGDTAPGADIAALVEDCITEMTEIATPKATHRIFGAITDETIPCVHIAGTEVSLSGRDIVNHLRGAEKVAVLAATLGLGVDRTLRRHEHGAMTRALVLSATATEAIEAVCDDEQARIGEQAEKLGLIAGSRFSPGYGDLPLDIQPALLRLVDAGRAAGITCTADNLMIPVKSVTAVVGLFKTPPAAGDKPGCAHCDLRDRCPYRKGGTTCVSKG